MGSRFKGTIHGDAMPFLNRFVGNPILTGMLNLFFGVKVSDAHCGMRAIRKDAATKLDLHSTGMEFASEMVFKAYRRGLTVSEIPIDYYPRIGESKLNRFSDAWRHVRFMLLYSPSWLYLVPGSILILLGLAGMLVLASGPVDVFGRTWQIHTMLGFVAVTLIGAQVIQLGVFARTYARVRIGEHDPLLERLGRGVRLEHGLLAGGALVFLAVAGLAAIGTEWAVEGFGDLGRAYETALLATTLGLAQVIQLGVLRAPTRASVSGSMIRCSSASGVGSASSTGCSPAEGSSFSPSPVSWPWAPSGPSTASARWVEPTRPRCSRRCWAWASRSCSARSSSPCSRCPCGDRRASHELCP